MVLVDGLDEVTDPAARSAVLTKLTNIAEAEVSSPYRFVVATRPLPVRELSWPNRFGLLPFDGRQLGRFAEGWFTALSVPDPRTAAAEFLTALKWSGMAEMVRTPLMATMLCQLYVQDAGRPLPPSRARWPAFLCFRRSNATEPPRRSPI